MWRCKRRHVKDRLQRIAEKFSERKIPKYELLEDSNDPCGSCGKMAAQQQNERKKKNDGEEVKFGVVAQAGSIPAIERLRQRHQNGCGQQNKRSELEQTPHN